MDTGCSQKIPGPDDTRYPQMPMIHLISTYGTLFSYYVLNTQPTCVDICSPPRPIDPAAMVLFKSAPPPNNTEMIKTPPNSVNDFSGAVTSTPAATKPKPTFGGFGDAPKPQGTSLFGTGAAMPAFGSSSGVAAMPAFGSTTATSFGTSTGLSFGTAAATTKPVPSFGNSTPPFGTTATTAAPSFGTGLSGFGNTPSFSVAKPTTPATAQAASVTVSVAQSEKPKPLITVPPNYTAPPVNANKQEVTRNTAPEPTVNSHENDFIYRKMINEEMKTFEAELRQLMDRSKSIQINVSKYRN